LRNHHPHPNEGPPIDLPEAPQTVSPHAIAALLVAARTHLAVLGLPCPSVDAIVTATGASRSRAYELSAEILERLPTLVAPRGRPPKPSPAHAPDATTLTEVVLGFVMDHPGCVDRDERRRYSDAFRHFVLDQHRRHAALDLEVFAAAVHVPLGTLKDWLRDRSAEAPPAPPSSPPPAEPTADSLHMQTVLDAWKRWDGSFLAFCEHVRVHLHVPFGRSQVRAILEVHGARRTKRRPGRTPDESALRGSFKTYFPGAQWVGDGMQVPVVVDGSRFTFNVELDVDAHSGAFVGASIRDQEDAQAVVEAFDDGVATTGSPPVALLLDNRPSNHTPEVDAALSDTLRVRATPERPQNKAHVEGAFGLFSQVLPPLVIDTRRRARDLAKCILVIVTTLWARTTNHRPRRTRAGRSRVELYADKPSAEQLAEARRELQELLARQERARRTLEARRRPDVLAFLDEHFDRLGLLDPDRHVRIAIAGHPFDAIVAGLAIFEGKRRANTLPEGADARYLLGIVANVAAKKEGELVAERLLELRLEVRDRMLAALARERDALFAVRDLDAARDDCVDLALDTDSPLERAFWLAALAHLIRDRATAHRQDHFRAAARRIHATFAVPLRARHDAVRAVAERLVAIA
jgi:hypothetical protein